MLIYPESQDRFKLEGTFRYWPESGMFFFHYTNMDVDLDHWGVFDREERYLYSDYSFYINKEGDEFYYIEP